MLRFSFNRFPIQFSLFFLNCCFLLPAIGFPQSTSSESPSQKSLFASKPVLRPNPQLRAPLVATIEVEATVPVTGSVEINDGKNSWVIDGPQKPSKKLRLIAHSLRPDRKHEIQVRLQRPDSNVTQVSAPLKYTTNPLPRNFPPIEVTHAEPDKMEPGVLFFPINLWRDDKSVMDFGYLIALNEQGEVIWYMRTGHRTADVRLLRNGNILFQHGNYRFAFEIDLMGNLIRQWHTARLTQSPHRKSIPIDIDTMHHEIAEHPNGNFFTFSTDLVKFDSFPTSVIDPKANWEPAHVVCDQLIEFVPETGEVVRRIELKDYLDQKRFSFLSLGSFWKPKYDRRINASSKDWSHANALLLLPDEDAAIISFRHLDCLMKFDLKKEEIIWIMGTPDGWGEEWKKYLLKPEGDNFKWPYHQHGPQLTANGNIRLYDNGNYRVRPFNQPLTGSENNSRVVEFAINEEAKTVRQVWEYDGAPDNMFFCPFYCEADLMEQTGNYLITDGGHIELEDGTPYNTVPGQHQWARIFEIEGKAPYRKVFEVKCESSLKSPYGWSIYRSMKLNSLSDIKAEMNINPKP